MQGWLIPPPKEPTKTAEQFEQERISKVKWLIDNGYLQSQRIKDALSKVPREEFIPSPYRDYAYLEVPFPLPGEVSTISCPHSYPLFYEPLGLTEGDRFLEIGLGSGYGSAIAREVVGPEGLVVSIEIDPLTFEFGRQNLEHNGYKDVVLHLGDGGLGFADRSPYDRIAITAACNEIPTPLIEQLRLGGRLIAPVQQGGIQDLILIEKLAQGLSSEVICQVLYVSLQGAYGT